MKYNVYSVFDSKALNFGSPIFLVNHGSALRAFTDAANSLKGPVGQHPEDYTLFQIGEYDDESGSLIPFERHVNLGLAASFVKQNPGLIGPIEEVKK